jgi:hypothetical protein
MLSSGPTILTSPAYVKISYPRNSGRRGAVVMGSSEKFCLKWNDFKENISSSLQGVRKDQDFSDVTLTCDGDTRIEAHRVILAGSSKFFSKVLKQQQYPHPLLYMRGMTADQLNDVVDFIYHGEVKIYQEDLEAFLSLAEELQLKGLNETHYSDQEREQPKYIAPQIQKRKSFIKDEISNIDRNVWQDLDQIQEPEPLETALVSTDAFAAKIETNYEGLDATVNSMMEKNDDGKRVCKVCGKIARDKGHMRDHIEGKHINGVSHPCSLCGKSFRSRNSLGSHISQAHKLF